MIFLTGDVHETAPHLMDQNRLPTGWTEMKTCEDYLEIANKHSICPTLFFTGLAVKREGKYIRMLSRRYQFEVGGHGFSSGPRILLKLSRRLLNLANGPYFLQKRDMSATIQCIEDQLGMRVTSWRNHAYRMDRNTYRTAAELGVRQVSNRVTGVEGTMREEDGILEVPINTLPDHESLGHGYHKPICSSVQDWVDQVLRQVEYQQAQGLPSIILAHPLCMFIEDCLAAFERLCATIGTKQTAPLRELTHTFRQPALAAAGQTTEHDGSHL